jgi:hypothetical protein
MTGIEPAYSAWEVDSTRLLEFATVCLIPTPRH